MNSMDNPYDVLGVQREATPAEIKAAYRKLALRHHPDKVSDPALKQEAHERFAKISNAYEILSNESTRQEYNASLNNNNNNNDNYKYGTDYAYQDPFRHQQSHYDAHFQHHFDQFHFHDPFQVFAQAFQQEFGNFPRTPHRSARNSFFNDPFFSPSLFQNVFGNQPQQQQPSMVDPFFDHDPFFGGGGGGDLFSQMHQRMMMQQQQMDMMHRQASQQQQQRGGMSSFYSSSSSSSFGGGHGGRSESVRTTTRIVNGQRETVTERTVTLPDGTVERHVETTHGENGAPPQLPNATPPRAQIQQDTNLGRRKSSRRNRPSSRV